MKDLPTPDALWGAPVSASGTTSTASEGPRRGCSADAARIQRLTLRALVPIMYTSRVMGVAPYRWSLPAGGKGAVVCRSSWWVVYSIGTIGFHVLLGILLNIVYYEFLTFNNVSTLMQHFLHFSKVLKLLTSVLITVFSIVKVSNVTAALHKLVQISSHAAVIGSYPEGLPEASTAPNGLPNGVWMTKSVGSLTPHLRHSRQSPTRGAEAPTRIQGRFMSRLQSLRWIVIARTLYMTVSMGTLMILVGILGRSLHVAEVLSITGIFLVSSQFTDAAGLLGIELEALNDSLETRFESGPRGPTAWDLLDRLGVDADISWIDMKTKSNHRQPVHAARTLHRDLFNSFYELDDAFGFQNLLFLMVTFVHMTLAVYVLFVEGVTANTIIVSSVMYVVQLLWMMSVGQLIKDESKRTAVAVHSALLRPDLSEFTRAELQDFSVQLLAAEMCFSAWGFFPMDYSLLQSFVGTVVTYIVILIQFGGSGSSKAEPTSSATASSATASSAIAFSNFSTAHSLMSTST